MSNIIVQKPGHLTLPCAKSTAKPIIVWLGRGPGCRFKDTMHIFLARDAPVGLVIWRGPARQFAALRWDRRTDLFELGQWMRGQIALRNSDLSPDGRFFVYFIQKYQLANTPNRGSWTAVSRVPYLKAISLLPLGNGYGGGGLWTGVNRWCLNESTAEKHTVLYESAEVVRDAVTPLPDYPWYTRRHREGWQTIQRCYQPGALGKVDIFQKKLPHGWTLCEMADCHGHHLQYTLYRHKPETVVECTGWQWADMDGNRLVWATGGKLWCASLAVEKLTNIQMLYDFNPLRFQRILAPY